MLELLSPIVEGLGFNLCVVPFLNICVLNLTKGRGQSIGQRWSEFGQRCHTRVGKREPSQRGSEDEER